jgi:hypothetical protein
VELWMMESRGAMDGIGIGHRLYICVLHSTGVPLVSKHGTF